MNYNINVPGNVLDSIIMRVLFIIPLIGFLYYFNYIVIQRGVLIKPLSQRLYIFEPPLAFYFSLSFIPFLILGIFGSKILKKGLLNKILTNRIISLIFFIGALYIVVWRLNGGLFLKKNEYNKLRNSLDGVINNKTGLHRTS